MTERATDLLQQPFTDAVMPRPLPDLSEVISDFMPAGFRLLATLLVQQRDIISQLPENRFVPVWR